MRERRIFVCEAKCWFVESRAQENSHGFALFWLNPSTTDENCVLLAKFSFFLFVEKFPSRTYGGRRMNAKSQDFFSWGMFAHQSRLSLRRNIILLTWTISGLGLVLFEIKIIDEKDKPKMRNKLININSNIVWRINYFQMIISNNRKCVNMCVRVQVAYHDAS